MNILIVCSWALPHAGGINTYVNQLKQGLRLAGHTVDVFSPTPDGQGFYIPERVLFLEKSRIYPLIESKTNRFLDLTIPGVDPIIKHSEAERYCIEIAARYFGLDGYDLIHAQDIVSAHAFSRIKPVRTALVSTFHGCLAKEWFVKLKEMGLPEQDSNSPLWRYSALRETIGATVSDVTITPSLWLKKLFVEEFSVPEQKIVVCPYGIDVEQFHQRMQQNTGIVKNPKRKVFICPARFDAVKGHIYLLHAFAQLKAERSDWECWLVGDGALLEKMRETAKQLGIGDHMIFMGSREDVPSLIRLADFFVLPSIQDNQPFAVIEAQISGKPIIVSNAGGIPEMIEHLQTGLVFPAGDSNHLYFFLRIALENETLMRSLALRGQTRGNHKWALTTMTANLLPLYELARSINAEQVIHAETQKQNLHRGGGKWRITRKRRVGRKTSTKRLNRRLRAVRHSPQKRKRRT